MPIDCGSADLLSDSSDHIGGLTFHTDLTLPHNHLPRTRRRLTTTFPPQQPMGYNNPQMSLLLFLQLILHHITLLLSLFPFRPLTPPHTHTLTFPFHSTPRSHLPPTTYSHPTSLPSHIHSHTHTPIDTMAIAPHHIVSVHQRTPLLARKAREGDRPSRHS
jgi:hypothetical protein